MANPIFRLLLLLTLCVPVPLYGQRTPPNQTPDKSQFIVFIYTPSPDAKPIKQIAGKLFQAGYSVNEPLKRKGEGRESEVYYYDDSALDMAKEVAQIVRATCSKFSSEPRRGRGGPVNGFDVWIILDCNIAQ